MLLLSVNGLIIFLVNSLVIYVCVQVMCVLTEKILPEHLPELHITDFLSKPKHLFSAHHNIYS